MNERNISQRIREYRRKGETWDVVKVVQVERMVRACMNHLKKQRYEYNISTKDVNYAVKVLNVVDDSRSTCWGGSSIIHINIAYWQHNEAPHYHSEYRSYDDNPCIGGRWIAGKYAFEYDLWLTVSHEVSHHVQRRICPRLARYERDSKEWKRGRVSKPHGRVFKEVYRDLRADLVNPLIDSGESYFKPAQELKAAAVSKHVPTWKTFMMEGNWGAANK